MSFPSQESVFLISMVEISCKRSRDIKGSFWPKGEGTLWGLFGPVNWAKNPKCRQSLYIANFMVPIYRPGKMYTNLTVLMTHFWW